MSDSKQGNTIAREEVENLCRINGEPTWLKDNRLAGWEAYLQCPMPTGKTEDWRTTIVDTLDLSELTAVEPIAKATKEITLELLTSAKANLGDLAGVYVEDYATGSKSHTVDKALTDKGVVFAPLKTALEQHSDVLKGLITTERAGLKDKFTLMNQALWTDGLYLRVPKNTTIDLPFVFMVNLPVKAKEAAAKAEGSKDSEAEKFGQAVFPKVILVAEENSKVNFVTMIGSQESAQAEGQITLANASIELHLAAGANVSVAEVSNMGEEVFLVNRIKAFIGKDATLDYTTAGLGAKQIKADIETILTAPGATARVNGVVLGDSDEHFAYNTIADHTATDTNSNIVFRVALKDESTSIYQGIIKVEKIAQRTDSYQSNKNLLLGTEARADSIPKLEILADDVKCSHGATVGPVDKEQLFYLNSRGLTLIQAEEMIVTGFFQQVLDTIPITGVAQWMSKLVADKIRGTKAEASD